MAHNTKKLSLDQERASGSSKSVVPTDSDAEKPSTLVKNAMKWKNNVGYLPGSVIRYKLDLNGEILMAEDDDDLDEESFRARQTLMTANPAVDETDDVARCKNCKIYELKKNFFKGSNFCNECVHLSPLFVKMLTQYEENESDNHGAFDTFSWDVYLEKNDFTAIPDESFLPSQLRPTRENGFQVGMKMEGVDPFHPSRFCVLTVAEIIGPRLRLHFDGYKRKYDFWVNANSEFIFPAGFCKSTNRKLEPPRGIEAEADDFDWERYIAETIAVTAPATLFACPTDDPEKLAALVSLGFKVGRKLEAVDSNNNNLVCVATIKDILNDHLLIHFDGWDDSYDYWAHHTSPLLHPVNWCHFNGRSLTAPKNYQGGDRFNWNDYLAKTRSVSVLARAFKNKPKNSWKKGMKLEAVDLQNPRFIRVATIASRTGHFVKIHFDGWSNKYDYSIDVNCPDLHPIHWCSQTNHPLEPPPSSSATSANRTKVTCTIPNCYGIGHVRWYNHKSHNTIENCPYTDKNMGKEPSDRYESDNESVESDEDVEDSENEDSQEAAKREENDNVNEKEREDQEEMSISDADEPELLQYSISLLEQENYSLQLPQSNLARCKCLLKENESEFELDKVSSWDYILVERFVRVITGCQQTAAKFSYQKIDGESMLLLTLADLTDNLNIKFGPAIKIHSCIAELKATLLTGDGGHQ